MKIGIEKLLQWAFTQELCSKKPAYGAIETGTSNFTMIMEIIRLGAVIDRTPNIMAASSALEPIEPHIDAQAVRDAVRALSERRFEIAEGWNPFPEWADETGLIAENVRHEVDAIKARGEATSGRQIVALVYTCAILGRGPDWTADKPKVVTVKHAGKEAWFVQQKNVDLLGRPFMLEVNGYDRKRKRPVRGAYRKQELAEPILGDILSRLEWQLWQDALSVLHKSLHGRLLAHDLLPFVPRRQPWAIISNGNENRVSA